MSRLPCRSRRAERGYAARPGRGLRLSYGVLAAALCVAATGCGHFKQVQYFEAYGVPDPASGKAPKAYYRMTVQGHGCLVREYKMQAAYVSAAAVDAFNSRTPSIPVVDLPDENLTAFRAIKGAYLQTLVDHSTTRAGIPTLDIYPQLFPPPKATTAGDKTKAAKEPASKDGPAPARTPAVMPSGEQDGRAAEIARQAWLASLSDGDIVSLGFVGQPNPYQFRKLVFFVTATNFDVNQMGDIIDLEIDKIELLAEAMRKRREAESTKDDQLWTSVGAAIAGNKGLSDQEKQWLDILIKLKKAK